MRILHTVPYLPRASGVTTFVVGVTEELKRRGNDVVIAVHDLDMEVAASSHVPRIGTREALSRMKAGKFDIIHLHGIWPPFMHRYVRLADMVNTPIVWSLHGMLSESAMSFKRWRKIVAWRLWQKHDLLCANIIHATSGMECQWAHMLGISNRIVTIPLGTNIPNKRLIAHSDEERTLLFVGRVHPIKALDNLMRAWAICRGDQPLVATQWKLRIVGTANEQYKTYLLALASDLGILDSVVFAGPKYEEALEEEYRNADYLVLPSHSENFGGVVADALARGLPVITSTGTPWEAIVASRCGWWVDNEPHSLATAIKQAMALSKDERLSMCENGFELVKQSYSWPIIAQHMQEAYESLLNR